MVGSDIRADPITTKLKERLTAMWRAVSRVRMVRKALPQSFK
jgi:hypothetical protein